MNNIFYEKDGDPLKIKFKVENGVIAIAYTIKLSERDSNKAVAYYDGDNQNPEDDVYFLPIPIEQNNERILRLSATFYPLDLDLSKKYLIKLEVYQRDILLDSIEQDGDLTLSTQAILLFAKLKIKGE